MTHGLLLQFTSRSSSFVSSRFAHCLTVSEYVFQGESINRKMKEFKSLDETIDKGKRKTEVMA